MDNLKLSNEIFKDVINDIWKGKDKKANGSASRLPPGPPKLPLIGNLHLLIDTEPHRCFARLAQKYGPVMHMQLGEVPTVVISSPEGAKEVMKTHDSIFSERPYLYAAEMLSYNFEDTVFSRGEYLRQTRKICATELLSQRRVQSFRPIREEEMTNLIRTMSSKAGQSINLKDLLHSSALSIISRTAFGGKCKYQEAFKKLIPDIADSLGGLSIVDVYPSIKLLHLINAMRPKNKRLCQKVDEILENIIQEHRVRKSAAKGGEDEVADDLVQVLLDIQDHGDLEIPLSTSSIKAITLVSYFINCFKSCSLLCTICRHKLYLRVLNLCLIERLKMSRNKNINLMIKLQNKKIIIEYNHHMGSFFYLYSFSSLLQSKS